MEKQELKGRAWVVAVDMGYGHQRTAYPLKDMAFCQKVINANHYEGIPAKDRKNWERMRSLYELISRFKRFPIIGWSAFWLLDRFQKIADYYPKKDMSVPNLSGRNVFWFLRSWNWGFDLVERMKKNPLPVVSTFFVPAFMAEYHRYPNDIYCVICDADINRAWVSLDPRKSKIKYFAPCSWVENRLQLYGIKKENITLTGYPLPKENVGEKLEIAAEDLRHRLVNLDPEKRYIKMYHHLIKSYLGKLPKKSNHPLTITFSIGGAGAQKEICAQAINSLAKHIRAKKLRFIIAIGVREELKKYFEKNLKGLRLDGWVHILSAITTDEYFKLFNQALRETDILWTKPSELSFYSGLGIPIIVAQPIGSQEDFNKRWILHTGSGISQEDPKYAYQWFFDILKAGDFAEMALQGFVEIEKRGTYHIEKIIEKDSFFASKQRRNICI